MRIALVDAGVSGKKHLDSLKNIDGVEIPSVIILSAEQAADGAAEYSVPQ